MGSKIYVSTLRLLTKQGPSRPKFTEPLRGLLRLRGHLVIAPQLDAAGNDVVPATASGAWQVLDLVLLRSSLNPANADMEVQAVLQHPDGKLRADLGPYSVNVPLDPSDFAHGDLKSTALKNVLEQLYLPLVNAVDAATP